MPATQSNLNRIRVPRCTHGFRTLSCRAGMKRFLIVLLLSGNLAWAAAADTALRGHVKLDKVSWVRDLSVCFSVPFVMMKSYMNCTNSSPYLVSTYTILKSHIKSLEHLIAPSPKTRPGHGRDPGQRLGTLGICKGGWGR